MLKPVDPRQSLPKLEDELLQYWDEKKIFEQSVQKDAPAGSFVFYEGPPTANGKPGLHHVLARAFKDAVPRYRTMKGYRVERKAGWDTHGLPVELQVEKKLGLRSKVDIENIVPGDPRASIIAFNAECKKSVWEYRDLWEKMTRRMGYWVDMKNPYITYENDYIESVWWIMARIAELKDKAGESMLYKGRKVVPYCYRCGTALSSHEVAQGYQTVKDNSVYVKFKLTPGQKIGDFTTDEKTFALVWTTTPWTLPGNMALAVGPAIKYMAVKDDKNDVYVFIQPLDSETQLHPSGEVLAKFAGADLVGLTYEPLYQNGSKHPFQILAGDFVSTTEGTGIVHIAPAFGEDDLRVAKENGYKDVVTTVDLTGRIVAGFAFPGEGELVKKRDGDGNFKADNLIVEDLKKRNLFFASQPYEHEYPFCWRCDTPLIYYAKPSWFIRMSALNEKLVANNENISWVPENIKEGRFGEWLKGAKDWAISRERYWGTPLPFWECDKCDAQVVVESTAQLEKLSGKKLDDLHKPYIDEVDFACEKCDGVMRRTPEVGDVWFDSGAMPLAQMHYPFSEAGKAAITDGKAYPADFISEAVDQTRGWFYTLHAIATLMQQAGVVKGGAAYKHVICLGHILDGKGKKMSKSRGNVVDPFELMDTYGADLVRWLFFTINPPGLPKRFDIKAMRDVQNRFFRMLWNSYSFFVMYAKLDNFSPSRELINHAHGNEEYTTNSNSVLDKWIISSLNALILEVDTKMNDYDLYGSCTAIEKYIDDLSNWYIRRSRKRFWKNQNDSDKKSAYETLYVVLQTLAKLLAPFTPFLADSIYHNLTSKNSVHLANFPVVNNKLIDTDLNTQMTLLREAVSVGLQKRAESKIKVRQPLAAISLGKKFAALFAEGTEYVAVISEELNVKAVTSNTTEEDIILDTNLTPELEQEGLARDVVRAVQKLRKDAGLAVDDRIVLSIAQDDSIMQGVVKNFGDYIATETLATQLVTELPDALAQIEEKIGALKVVLALKRA